jgi:pyruvate dehydrogenase E2 component (dihydrolipoamide acetyltransferase)
MIEVVMPRLSDSMEEGTILRWIASDGEQITRGQELVEIETDKASMIYEADDGGVLHILAHEGDTIVIGVPIAQLAQDGEQPPAQTSSDREAGAQASGEEDHGQPLTAPNGDGATDEPAESSTPASQTPARTSAAASATATVGAATSSADTPSTRVKASPLARRRAAALGIDIAEVAGSGPGGRVVVADVEATPAPVGNGASKPGSDAQETAGARGEVQVVELSRIQSLIARRMAEAKATIPEFTLQCEVDMEAAVKLRADLKGLGTIEERPTPSYNDMVVKACALALREFPRANGTYKDGHFELHGRINVGVAVAAKDALVVPVVHDADTLSPWQVAELTRALASAVRDGSITPPQLAGGTFSVSNLGMYGVDAFTAVINPPQAAILAVGSLAQRAVVRDGELVARNTMTITLSCDHRIVYGADAAEFLARVRERLERPLSLFG